MTRTERARIAATRCEQQAAAQDRAGLADLARTSRENAAAWQRIAAEVTR